jgi:hypothetical protein
MTALPLHPHLTHPHTGERLRAIGFTSRGPIWPQLGASPDDPPADPADPTDPPAGDPPADPKPDPKPDADQLGDAGKKALAAEREQRKAAEKELAKYRKADQDRVDADKTEAEKRAAAEQRATDAEMRATRLEVAHEKGLTPAQAKRLVGTTKEELEADADEILRDFPTAPAKPAGPKPDPSQGARGETKNRPTSLGAAVAQHYTKP